MKVYVVVETIDAYSFMGVFSTWEKAQYWISKQYGSGYEIIEYELDSETDY